MTNTRLCQKCNETDISEYHHLKRFCTECQQEKNYELVMKRQEKKKLEGLLTTNNPTKLA